jgi:hypothetical protein
MFKDIGFPFFAGLIIYNTLRGKVSVGGYGYITRKEHPIYFWIITPLLICVATILLLLALNDFYHRFSA